MEKKFLSTGFVLAGVCLLSYFSVFAQSDKAVTSTTQVYKISGKPGLNGVTNTVVNGKEYNITIKNGTVTELYIDNNKIPNENIVEHKTVLDKIFSRFKMTQEQAMRDREQAARDREQATKDREQAMRDREQATKDREQATKDREQAMRDREQAVRDREQAARDRKQAVRDREQMESIFEELISEHIIKNKKELHSFQLSDGELIVNGIKQSTILHKKLRDKYLTNKSVTLWYETE